MNEDMTPEGKALAPGMKRRRLIAGAATLVAGIIATRTAERVAAANGDPLRAGQVVQSDGAATVLAGLNFPTNVPVFRVLGTNNTASLTDDRRDAIQGYAFESDNTGVVGRNDSLNGGGVAGVASNGVGTYGQTGGGSGVAGVSLGAGNGVYGLSASGTGVFAQSTSSAASLISVNFSGGPGGLVSSSANHGMVAGSSAPFFGGFAGAATGTNVAGVIGGGANGAFAGFFTGPVLVNGQQVVTGSKSAAVPHPDGSMRLLYCVEAPEAWFEDFGEATLTAGRAEVRFDPDFAAVVDTSKMHVFVTEHSGNNSLHIPRRTANGFSVQADTSSVAARGRRMEDVTGSFSYRVVARRKDVKAERLARFTMPKINVPDATNLQRNTPKPPQVPARRA